MELFAAPSIVARPSLPAVNRGASVEDLPVILLVEDEELIRNIVEETLGDGGFKVIVAKSGDEAVRLLDSSAPKYRALVTDIKLSPGTLSGWDVARHARAIDPELAVVYMTGDSAAEWASQGVPNSVLLTKPFAPAQLLTAVAQLLNVGGQNPS
ncbi:Response regulator receiver domain-containing protein [Tardiphaga sp. OK245]|nr:Response regulator receiver domain-containing protein [Tardiphaga sp. OK245]